MAEKKTVWLVNQYAMPPQYESRLRTIKFAQYLQTKGYEVTIFASSIMHNMDIDLIEGDEPYIECDYDDLHFVHIKAKNYHNNGVNRIISSFQFHWRMVKFAQKFKKPDVIVQTALIPFGNVISRLAKKTRAKYIVEVLDLWPNSLVELGVAKASNPVIKYLYHLEYKQYQHADELVFSQEGGPDYLSDRKWYKEQGGIAAMEKKDLENAAILYDEIDRNKLFRGTVAEEDRSIMNVCFVMNDEYKELEDEFSKYATAAGMVGIKGHRSVGGFRASLYNAMPKSSVEALVACMKEFEKQH